MLPRCPDTSRILQALASAVALLADIEAQIRSALGLSSADSDLSSLADPEQLQHVPPKLLQSLEVCSRTTDSTSMCCTRRHAHPAFAGPVQSAVSVVQELRDQLHAQRQQGDNPPPAAKRCASPQQARTRRTASASTPQPRHASSAPNIAAARSALFDRGASDFAVSNWHEAKLVQQQEATLAQGRLLAREEQAQDALDDAEEAAHLAHVKVCGGGRHCTTSNACLPDLPAVLTCTGTAGHSAAE